ncbi:MAG TPA: sugar transferase [Anaerolineaceae bacterium]|nr:sugar transferase [Anaerolineaceae bacterium]HPN50928.1 sugar transferase [Anaerolineaceae bacterium]
MRKTDGIPLSKRVMDILLTLPVAVVLLPVMGVVGLLVLLVEGRPVFFSQERPGYRGKIFRMIKFRTMRIAVGADGKPLPDSQRLSGLGRFLRATSLDELPELWHVLKGEMSLVGPRPLLVQYLERYTPEQARRHEVLPGITGWAQVNGRNAIGWEEKFALDVWYVDHWSLGLDIKILWMTAWKVIKREGVSQAGQATAEEFMGTKK